MKILIEKAVIEQALEAFGGYASDFNIRHYDLITALREALDPELQFVRDWNEGKVHRVSDGKVMGFAEQAEGAIVKTCPDGYGTITTEQAEQEPVAWGMKSSNGAFFTITPKERAAMHTGYEYETINATSLLDIVSMVIAVVIVVILFAIILCWGK